MSEQDAEIEWLKAEVNCAALLERLPPVWRLDRAESSRRSLKYRRGEGKIVIVNHAGRGWWDPLSDRKGDIFTLVRYLEPGLNFADARRVLRGFVGIAPVFPETLRARREWTSPVAVADRWARRPPLSPGSPAWRYLTERRGLTETILVAACAADAIREGPRGSAWFAHRDGVGRLSGIEMRGAEYRKFSAGGEKTLFRLPGGPGRMSRIAVCEAAIDTLSLAAIERGHPRRTNGRTVFSPSVFSNRPSDKTSCHPGVNRSVSTGTRCPERSSCFSRPRANRHRVQNAVRGLGGIITQSRAPSSSTGSLNPVGGSDWASSQP
jgi:hypothetical protein